MMAFWLGLPPWVRTALIWAGAIALAVITGKLIIAKHDERILKEARLRAELEAEKVQSEVISQITEATNEVIREDTAVREHPAIVVMPDGTSRLPDYHFRDQ